MSEIERYRDLVVPYCTGDGVDVGSQGVPVVPHAIQVDLPKLLFEKYSGGQTMPAGIHIHGDALDLPFKSNTMGWVCASHLLEDFADWNPAIDEWTRVLMPSGYLIILLPDKQLWAEALAKGQPPNCAHRHEAAVGELSLYAKVRGLNVIRDSRTNLFTGDYSILFIAQKLVPTPEPKRVGRPPKA